MVHYSRIKAWLFSTAEIRDGTHQTDFPMKIQGLQFSTRNATNYGAEPICIHRTQLLFGSSLSAFSESSTAEKVMKSS